MPPVLVWMIGAVGVVIVAKLVAKEWRRVNAELDKERAAMVADPQRRAYRSLRRDPKTGEYRP